MSVSLEDISSKMEHILNIVTFIEVLLVAVCEKTNKKNTIRRQTERNLAAAGVKRAPHSKMREGETLARRKQ